MFRAIIDYQCINDLSDIVYNILTMYLRKGMCRCDGLYHRHEFVRAEAFVSSVNENV